MYFSIVSHYRNTSIYSYLLIYSKSCHLIPRIICHASTNLSDLDRISGTYVGNFRPNYKTVDKKP